MRHTAFPFDGVLSTEFQQAEDNLKISLEVLYWLRYNYISHEL